MALQGTLDTFALPDVLRLLAATSKTGRLRISGTRGSGSLWVDGGAVVAVDATHAPHATDPVDALFELLRFEDGSFSFDAEASPDRPGEPQELEPLLAGAEALLAEWNQIVAVVPSMDAWVTLQRTLGDGKVTIDQERWTSLVAVGSGATVRRMAEELCLPELPVSRAVRDLVDLGLVEIVPAPPASEPSDPPLPASRADADVHEPEVVAGPVVSGPVEAAEPAPEVPGDDAPLPAARPLRARRAKPRVVPDEGAQEPEHFVPLELPGHATATYDPIEEHETEDASDDAPSVADLAAAFPGLAGHTAEPTPEEQELARQLGTLSPRAAGAIRAAAEATTIEERDAALDDADDGEGEPINRGLLLKFLSSVKG